MKKLIPLFTLFFCTILVSAQWKLQSPLPTGNVLRSVYFTDAIIGYTVGDNGMILKTTDGGSSWTTFRPPYPYNDNQ